MTRRGGYKLGEVNQARRVNIPTPDANGNTPATSWNGFPVGESTVTYKVEGKIAGGTAATKTLR